MINAILFSHSLSNSNTKIDSEILNSLILRLDQESIEIMTNSQMQI